jgi:uncharacterized membrane protein
MEVEMAERIGAASGANGRPAFGPGRYLPHPHRATNPREHVRSGYTLQDRIALTITTAVGTMYAVYVFALFMAGWMLIQTLSGRTAFDPFPFAFLLFLGNIVQLLLMPLIMVGQNLQGRHAEARADEEFRTTQKTFADLETTMKHLDAQDLELLRQTTMLRSLVEKLLPPDEVERLEASFAAAAAARPASHANGEPGPA